MLCNVHAPAGKRKSVVLPTRVIDLLMFHPQNHSLSSVMNYPAYNSASLGRTPYTGACCLMIFNKKYRNHEIIPTPSKTALGKLTGSKNRSQKHAWASGHDAKVRKNYDKLLNYPKLIKQLTI